VDAVTSSGAGQLLGGLATSLAGSVGGVVTGLLESPMLQPLINPIGTAEAIANTALSVATDPMGAARNAAYTLANSGNFFASIARDMAYGIANTDAKLHSGDPAQVGSAIGDVLFFAFNVATLASGAKGLLAMRAGKAAEVLTEAATATRVAEIQSASTGTESATLTKHLFDDLAQARANQLAADPYLAGRMGLLTRDEITASQGKLGPTSAMGKAVERWLALDIQNSPSLQQVVRYVAGPNRADFFGTGALSDYTFDVTSSNARAIADHVLRGIKNPTGYQNVYVSTYDRPTSFGVYDPAGRVIEDLELRRCTFASGGLGFMGDVNQRTVVRRVTLRDCTVAGAAVGPVTLEDVTVEGLRTNGLLDVWGAVYKHVTLRGKIGRVFAKDLVRPQLRTAPEQRSYDAANAKFYKGVDWALDISEAEFEEFDLRGVPAGLVRRDPATQIVVTRKAATKNSSWRKLDYGRCSFKVGIELMIDAGHSDVVLVAEKRSKHFEECLRAIQRLREIGVAEPK
jgi:hypothetical protein